MFSWKKYSLILTETDTIGKEKTMKYFLQLTKKKSVRPNHFKNPVWQAQLQIVTNSLFDSQWVQPYTGNELVLPR